MVEPQLLWKVPWEATRPDSLLSLQLGLGKRLGGVQGLHGVTGVSTGPWWWRAALSGPGGWCSPVHPFSELRQQRSLHYCVPALLLCCCPGLGSAQAVHRCLPGMHGTFCHSRQTADWGAPQIEVFFCLQGNFAYSSLMMPLRASYPSALLRLGPAKNYKGKEPIRKLGIQTDLGARSYSLSLCPDTQLPLVLGFLEIRAREVSSCLSSIIYCV